MASVFAAALPLETTLAMVKPGLADQSDKVRDIISEARAAGFTVLAQTTRRLNRVEAEQFYAEHKGMVTQQSEVVVRYL
jgi:nucleoside diphosphate kinase